VAALVQSATSWSSNFTTTPSYLGRLGLKPRPRGRLFWALLCFSQQFQVDFSIISFEIDDRFLLRPVQSLFSNRPIIWLSIKLAVEKASLNDLYIVGNGWWHRYMYQWRSYVLITLWISELFGVFLPCVPHVQPISSFLTVSLTMSDERYKLWNSSICKYLQTSLMLTSIRRSSYVTAREQVPYSYIIRGKLFVLVLCPV
jgi:hypothetical protein